MMYKNIIIFGIFIMFILTALVVFPVVGLAQIPEDSPPVALTNPIGISDPRELIGRVISAVLGIVGSIALAVFVIGGFVWMTSAGNPDRVTKGKNMILWASLGLAVIFTSYVIVRFVIEALTSPA